MEEMSKVNQSQSPDEGCQHKATPDWTSCLIKQKMVRKGKKENLKQKKKLKNLEKKDGKSHPLDPDSHLLKNKSDQDNSVTTHESIQQGIYLPAHGFQQKPASLLNRLILKPPYVSLAANKISGDYGHSSAIFRRPVLEGNYYLQVLIREDGKQQKKIAYNPSVRVGICHHAYNCSFPLGNEDSIAYKSTDGSLVGNGEPIAEGEPFTHGDVIGILMKISPPHKVPSPNEINKDSTVSFFKNGKLIFEFKELKQLFYCFGVSFFNYSQVEILPGPESKYPMPVSAAHYYSVLNQKILYKDLESNKIFKI